MYDVKVKKAPCAKSGGSIGTKPARVAGSCQGIIRISIQLEGTWTDPEEKRDVV